MTRYHAEHLHPGELADLHLVAPAPPRAALLSIGLTLAAVAILLAFTAWLAWPAFNAVAEAAGTRPNACATLTPDECTAVMEAR